MLLLLVSIGFTTLGVVEANRAIRSQRRVAEHALHDYAGFVAWSYEQHARELFAAGTQEALGAVNHADQMHSFPKVPSAQSLPHYLPMDATCRCHRARGGPSPSAYFGWVLGSDTVGVALNTHPDPAEGWEVDRPLSMEHPTAYRGTYTPEERRWINDTLTRQIRALKNAGRFPIVLATHDSLPRLLVYTLMPTTWGDTLVYGAEYSRRDVARVLATVMYKRGLLPATFASGHSMSEMVQLRVTDLRGDVLFESEPVQAWALDDTTRMPVEFGSLLVRAQIKPSMANTLVIGGLPRSRLPFLLGLLAVAAALSFVAMGQIRREGELARLRSDFVASISHELRTPLAQMRLYLETLRLGRFTTEDQRTWSLDNVERETTRLSHLVERVLRFSRTGRPDDDAREPVDAASEVRRIIEEFQPLAAARGSRVTVSTEPVPSLPLRPAALRHLVLNLLDNAVKYGPPDQVIHVRVHPVADEVRIEVADEGHGVAEKDRASVWRPYARGKSAGHTAGSGLGLSIVRDVAAQHGGRAWMEATDAGRYARFVIALPVPTDDTRAADLTTAAALATHRPVLG
ncbi:MAG: HAMP domain-containing sensor histidine kinase [bacterium]